MKVGYTGSVLLMTLLMFATGRPLFGQGAELAESFGLAETSGPAESSGHAESDVTVIQPGESEVESAGEREEESIDGAEWIGRQVSDFSLPTPHGGRLSTDSFSEHEAVVAIFMGLDCPIGNSFIPTLNELHETFQSDRVAVVGIYANAGVTMEDVAKHVEQYNIAFPVCFDEQQLAVADLAGCELLMRS